VTELEKVGGHLLGDDHRVFQELFMLGMEIAAGTHIIY
jgi:hypothetical protein